MKHKKLLFFLIAESVLCIILSSLQQYLPDLFPVLSAFPFAHLGRLLRVLSLSGNTGNAVAIVLYIMLCSLPAGILFAVRRRTSSQNASFLYPEDFLLILVSLALFPVLWLMVNPAHLTVPGSESVLCAILWSFSAAWLTLRVLRSIFSSDKEQLHVWFFRILCAAAVYYIFELFGILFPALLEELYTMSSCAEDFLSGTKYSNTGLHFTVIMYLVYGVPSLLTVVVIFHALDLLDKRTDNAADLPESAHTLSVLCKTALTVSVVLIAFLNLLQLILYSSLRNIHISVVLPITDLALVLGILLLTRYITENKQLQDDNNLFI